MANLQRDVKGRFLPKEGDLQITSGPIRFMMNSGAVRAWLKKAGSSGLASNAMATLQRIGREIERVALDSAPVDTGALRRSSSVKTHRRGLSWMTTIAFNAKHAFIQDWPDALGQRYAVIRPRNATWLFVPLSARARKKSVGAKIPKKWKCAGYVSEVGRGRKSGGAYKDAADYLMAGRVYLRSKGYRSNIGPNQYLSGTIKRKQRWIRAQIGGLSRRAFRK